MQDAVWGGGGGVVFVDLELAVERLQYTACRHSEGQVLIDWGLCVPTIK